MKRLMIFASLACLVLLSACAPTADPGRVEISQLTQPISFYPQEAGATWTYLPDGARLDEAPVYKRIEGPTVVAGEVWIATRLVGRGLDTVWLRQYRPDGMYLLSRRLPGAQITFDPPIKELPSPSELEVGAFWRGEAQAEVYFPEATPENQRRRLTFDYAYTVVDERPVTVQGSTFDVFVINFESHTWDENGKIIETVEQETWFAPYVGEVRTENDFFLIDTNFLLEEEEAAR